MKLSAATPSLQPRELSRPSIEVLPAFKVDFLTVISRPCRFENCSGVVSSVPTLIGRGLYSSSSGDEISMPKPARPTYDFGRGVPSRIRIAQLEPWKPYNGVRLDRASPPDRLRRHVSWNHIDGLPVLRGALLLKRQ